MCLDLLHPAAGSCTWVDGAMKMERAREQAFPVEKKWGSPITQDTTCLVTALSHYGLLMRLSQEKLPPLPLLWWISPWLLNMRMFNLEKSSSSLILRAWPQISDILRQCFRFFHFELYCVCAGNIFSCWLFFICKNKLQIKLCPWTSECLFFSILALWMAMPWQLLYYIWWALPQLYLFANVSMITCLTMMMNTVWTLYLQC